MLYKNVDKTSSIISSKTQKKTEGMRKEQKRFPEDVQERVKATIKPHKSPGKVVVKTCEKASNLRYVAKKDPLKRPYIKKKCISLNVYEGKKKYERKFYKIF